MTADTTKQNLQFVKASIYLSEFNLQVLHCFEKSYTIPDTLSQLSSRNTMNASEDALNIKTFHMFTGFIIAMSENFHKQLQKAYKKDKTWTSVLKLLKTIIKWNQNDDEIHKISIEFSLCDGLIYYIKNNKYWLCIPSFMEKEIFQIAHNNNAHKRKGRAIERIWKSFYICHLNSCLDTYIWHCPDCECNQTCQHKPYGELNPIEAPSHPFQTIAMNWVLGLPIMQKGYDMLLTVMCKFSWKVLLISGIITWKVADWSWKLLYQLQKCDWGIPQIIILNQDWWFMSKFWIIMFCDLNCSLLFLMAYHPQTNGLSEWMNQTTEIVIWFLATGHLDKDWDLFLLSLQAQLNSAKYAVTEAALNELVYDVNLRSAFDTLNESHEETVSDLIIAEMQKMLQQKAAEATLFANVKAKIHYDFNHQAIEFKENDQVFLWLYKGYSLSGKSSRKISNQWCGLFRIIKRVGRLAYELELSSIWRIHPVVFITQIEPAFSDDFYEQPRLDMPDGIEVDGEMW